MSKKTNKQTERGVRATDFYAEITVRGFNQRRLLNALASGGVTVKRLRKISQSEMRIIIERKYTANCFAICREMCYNYSVDGVFGLLGLAKAALKRAGSLLAALLVLVAAVWLNGRITSVSVLGADEAISDAIEAKLSDRGIGRLTPKVDGLAKRVREIALESDDIADCSVEIRGTRLVLTVRERESATFPNDFAEEVVSGYDAVVTKVVVRHGTAKVKVGQTVKRGQTLIEGVSYSTSGEPLMKTRAAGVVYGTVARRRSFVVGEVSTARERTGRTARVTTLEFFGARVGGGKSPFERSKAKITTARLCGFIRVTSVFYEETRLVEKSKSLDELTRECTAKATAECFGEGEIKVRTHAREICAGTYEIIVFTENERIIS